MSPDFWAYDYLTAQYKFLGETDKCVQTWEAFLKQPNHGLGHSRANERLADHYMANDQWAKALPYAKVAAQSWSGAGLGCLARCYEGMGDLKQAHQWRKRISDRYQTSAYKWYFWCKRTGYGDVQSAEKLADEHFAKRANSMNRQTMERCGVYFLLKGERDKALDVFQKNVEKYHNPYMGLHGALVADELGKTSQRDKLLQITTKKGHRYLFRGRPLKELIDISRLFQKALQTDGPLDLRGVDEVISACHEGSRANIQCFVGKFLDLHGTPEQAHDYYDRAATSTATDKYNHILARVTLRRRDLEPGDFRRQPDTASAPAEETPRPNLRANQ